MSIADKLPSRENKGVFDEFSYELQGTLVSQEQVNLARKFIRRTLKHQKRSDLFEMLGITPGKEEVHLKENFNGN